MTKTSGRKRLALIAGLSTAALALGVGGVAYAVGGEEPEQRYVEIVDEPNRSPEGTTTQDEDCPDGYDRQQPDTTDPSEQA